MKGIVEERAAMLGEYIIESKATVRSTAKKFGVSKSTVHKDVSQRLKVLNPALYRQVREILDTIANSGNGSFLAVLKLFGKNNPQAYNSFPTEGYTLALDFKVNSKLKKLVDQLDEIVQQFGGRIYLTKDSMSRSSLTDYLKNVNSSKFVSLQHKRILNNK